MAPPTRWGRMNSTLLDIHFQPGEHDVICEKLSSGRYKNTHHRVHGHVGNRNFCTLVDEYLELYPKGNNNNNALKGRINASIIDRIRKQSPHGGFVSYCSKTRRYYEVGDLQARAEVKRAIRDAILHNKGKETRLPANFQPGNHHVVVGSSSSSAHFSGNHSMQRLVDDYLEQYEQADHETTERSTIIDLIITAIRRRKNGGFVRFCETNQCYFEGDSNSARTQVELAFREALAYKVLLVSPSQRNNNNNSNNITEEAAAASASPFQPDGLRLCNVNCFGAPPPPPLLAITQQQQQATQQQANFHQATQQHEATHHQVTQQHEAAHHQQAIHQQATHQPIAAQQQHHGITQQQATHHQEMHHHPQANPHHQAMTQQEAINEFVREPSSDMPAMMDDTMDSTTRTLLFQTVPALLGDLVVPFVNNNNRFQQPEGVEQDVFRAAATPQQANRQQAMTQQQATQHEVTRQEAFHHQRTINETLFVGESLRDMSTRRMNEAMETTRTLFQPVPDLGGMMIPFANSNFQQPDEVEQGVVVCVPSPRAAAIYQLETHQQATQHEPTQQQAIRHQAVHEFERESSRDLPAGRIDKTMKSTTRTLFQPVSDLGGMVVPFANNDFQQPDGVEQDGVVARVPSPLAAATQQQAITQQHAAFQYEATQQQAFRHQRTNNGTLFERESSRDLPTGCIDEAMGSTTRTLFQPTVSDLGDMVVPFTSNFQQPDGAEQDGVLCVPSPYAATQQATPQQATPEHATPEHATQQQATQHEATQQHAIHHQLTINDTLFERESSRDPPTGRMDEMMMETTRTLFQPVPDLGDMVVPFANNDFQQPDGAEQDGVIVRVPSPLAAATQQQATQQEATQQHATQHEATQHRAIQQRTINDTLFVKESSRDLPPGRIDESMVETPRTWFQPVPELGDMVVPLANGNFQQPDGMKTGGVPSSLAAAAAAAHEAINDDDATSSELRQESSVLLPIMRPTDDDGAVMEDTTETTTTFQPRLGWVVPFAQNTNFQPNDVGEVFPALLQAAAHQPNNEYKGSVAGKVSTTARHIKPTNDKVTEKETRTLFQPVSELEENVPVAQNNKFQPDVGEQDGVSIPSPLKKAAHQTINHAPRNFVPESTRELWQDDEMERTLQTTPVLEDAVPVASDFATDDDHDDSYFPPAPLAVHQATDDDIVVREPTRASGPTIRTDNAMELTRTSQPPQDKTIAPAPDFQSEELELAVARKATDDDPSVVRDTTSELSRMGTGTMERQHASAVDKIMVPPGSDAQPGKDDVICSNTRLATNHPGNIYFRGIIGTHVKPYKQAERVRDRNRVVSSVITLIRRRKGNFVTFCEKDKRCVELTDGQARTKIRKTLWRAIKRGCGEPTDNNAQESSGAFPGVLEEPTGLSFQTFVGEEMIPLASDFHPGKHDVLCSGAPDHWGNQNYLTVVEQHTERYKAAKSRDQVHNIIDSIIALIRGQTPKGRFVKFCDKSMRYSDIGDILAREKVSTTLRATLRNTKAECGKSNGVGGSTSAVPENLAEAVLEEPAGELPTICTDSTMESETPSAGALEEKQQLPSGFEPGEHDAMMCTETMENEETATISPALNLQPGQQAVDCFLSPPALPQAVDDAPVTVVQENTRELPAFEDVLPLPLDFQPVDYEDDACCPPSPLADHQVTTDDASPTVVEEPVRELPTDNVGNDARESSDALPEVLETPTVLLFQTFVGEEMIPLASDFLPGKHDVLSSGARDHWGNQYYQAVVDQHIEQYKAAESRDDRFSVGDLVIALIRGQTPKGRFVRFCKKSMRYSDIGDAQTREKVYMALWATLLRNTKRKRRQPAGEEKQQLPSDFEPDEHDVICSKGQGGSNHIGNKRYRKEIQCNADLYKQSKSDQEKCNIAKAVIALIRSRNGGFIEFDKKEKRYFEIGNIQARAKVCRTLLRFSNAKPKNPEKAPVEDDDDDDDIIFFPSPRAAHQEIDDTSATRESSREALEGLAEAPLEEAHQAINDDTSDARDSSGELSSVRTDATETRDETEKLVGVQISVQDAEMMTPRAADNQPGDIIDFGFPPSPLAVHQTTDDDNEVGQEPMREFPTIGTDNATETTLEPILALDKAITPADIMQPAEQDVVCGPSPPSIAHQPVDGDAPTAMQESTRDLPTKDTDESIGMLQSVPVLKQKILLASDFQPGEHDVVCSTAVWATTHRGNKSLQNIIQNHLDSYREAQSLIDKFKIVNSVVALIRRRKGRFVKFSVKDKRYFEVADKAAGKTVQNAFGQSIKIGDYGFEKPSTGRLETRYHNFRKIIDEHAEMYGQADEEGGGRGRIVDLVMAVIQRGTPEGGFGFNEKTQKSFNVGDQEARAKVRRALKWAISCQPKDDDGQETSSSVDKEMTRPTTKNVRPGEHDVICSKTSYYNNRHSGNVQFRHVIDDTLHRYNSQATEKGQKRRIVDLILGIIRCRGGGFVRFCKGRFVKVSNIHARAVVVRAFRQAINGRGGGGQPKRSGDESSSTFSPMRNETIETFPPTEMNGVEAFSDDVSALSMEEDMDMEAIMNDDSLDPAELRKMLGEEEDHGEYTLQDHFDDILEGSSL